MVEEHAVQLMPELPLDESLSMHLTQFVKCLSTVAHPDEAASSIIDHNHAITRLSTSTLP